MNTLQRISIVAGIILSITSLVYPPWNLIADDGGVQPVGYGFIWAPPHLDREHSAEILGWKIDIDLAPVTANQIDFGRLAMELAVIAVLCGGVALVANKSERAS